MEIQIDFDVFKALTALRETEEMTFNDILRNMLGISSTMKQEDSNSNALIDWLSSVDWVSSGVRFPSGTELRATFKGKMYEAKVENGDLIFDGKKYNSLSDAAKSVTIHQRNGWEFWECKLPNESKWKKCSSLKKK